MKNIWKRSLAMLLVVVMVYGFTPIGELAKIDWPTLPEGTVSSQINDGINAVKSAASWFGERLHVLSLLASAESYSGKCGADGSDVTWRFNTETSVLTISGTGRIADYCRSSPWYSQRKRIKQIIIDDGVTGIGAYAFDDCTNLTNIHIPQSVEFIGAWAFDECHHLLSIALPNGLQQIDEYAFQCCYGLTEVTIPKSVENIGTDIFSLCSAIERITVDNQNSFFSNDACGALFDKEKTCLIKFPAGNAMSEYMVPLTVKRIESRAFHVCKNLVELTIPEGITDIGEFAFSNCVRLNCISLPDSLVSLEEDAFCGCEKLERIRIPNGIKAIKWGTFEYCSGLKEVYFPESIDRIETYAFRGCTCLESVTLPNCLTIIGDGAFAACTSLLSILIPKNVIYIGNHAFEGCEHLGRATIPACTESIGDYAFCYCERLSYIHIPSSVTTIGDDAFSELSNDFYICSDSSNCYVKEYAKTNGITFKVCDGHDEGEEIIHTVSYNFSYNGGLSATKTSATVAEGAAIDLTPTATKSGWSFVGWNTNPDATSQLMSLNMRTSDVTLYAIFKKTLTGTFIDYSGTIKQTTTKTVDIYNKATSGTLTAPTQNTYTGWTKRGWSTGTSADASSTTNYTISSNTTFYGLYQRTLTLSYNANGGSPTPSNQTGTQYTNSYSISTYKNPSFTLANAISKSGSTFAGWAKGRSSGTVHSAGSSISISENTTMFAKWDPISTHTVKVQARNKTGTIVTVPNAHVMVYDNSNGQSKLLQTVTTDASGKAGFSVERLSKNQMNNLTVSAYIVDNQGSNIDGTDRNELFKQFGTTSNGDPIRFIYELHSETIDADGNWNGAKLPSDGSKQINLTLSEPRLKVNLAVSYLDDPGDVNYEQKVKNSMNYASQRMAQATDGHVMFNKILLVPTNDRLNFADTNNLASMADIQIQATISEGKKGRGITIHSNASAHGYYTDDTHGFDTDSFKKLPNPDAFAGRDGYWSVQLSGVEGAGWNDEIGTEYFSSTIVHELGHYLLGFFDEYMDAESTAISSASHTSTTNKLYKPGFGLMDNQKPDIELSRDIRDYAYLRGSHHATKKTNETYQSWANEKSCEQQVADLLTTGHTFTNDNDHNSYIENGSLRCYRARGGTYSFSSGTYQAHYTLAPSSENDRRAEYPYAALQNTDFIHSTQSKSANAVPAKAVKTEGGAASKYSTYISDSLKIIAYMYDEAGSKADFRADNKEYSFNGYRSINEGVLISTTGTNMTGEIYGEISNRIGIDFSSISWFKYSKGSWNKVISDIQQDVEQLNYQVRCDYSGDGLYIIMAKDANLETLQPVSIRSYQNSSNVDALSEITIQDPNRAADIAYYALYYSTQDFSSPEQAASGLVMIADGTDYMVKFDERNTNYYVKVIAVGKDGATSTLGASFVVKTGEADRDHDGIPDWYCNQYRLWGDDETKDIANSDENGNGISNLDEYLAGNDPTYFGEVTAFPVISIRNYTNNKTVDYRSTITFSTDEVKNPVEGAQIHWFINGQDKGANNTYTEKEAKATYTVQAKYMKGSEVLAESEIETVNVKTSFFAKLKAFFRALFGRLPKVVQEYLGVEIINKMLP